MSALFQSGLVVIFFFLFLHGRVKRRINFSLLAFQLT